MIRRIIILTVAFAMTMHIRAQVLSLDEPIRFLALGDSYTIGESVDESDRWPVQFVDSLKKRGYLIDSLKIIATTGWRTDQLQQAIENQDPTGFNLVSLLIGVNNQYQGGSLAVYEAEFEALLQKAIALAGGQTSRVFVLSIPDYAFTPFANGDTVITRQLDAFNQANRAISGRYGVPYFYITDISRRGLEQPELVASDGLHPSGRMYALWVERVMETIPDKKLVTQAEPLKPDGGNAPLEIFQQYSQLHIKPKFTPADLFLFELGTGRLVLQRKLEPNTYNILNTSGLSRGIYLYSIVRNAHTRYAGKLFI
jgi:lysophospholipase L1-like esterase